MMITFITIKELLKLVPYSETHIYRLERTGKFPKRVKVGARRVAWLYQEIMDWIAERVREGRPVGSSTGTSTPPTRTD